MKRKKPKTSVFNGVFNDKEKSRWIAVVRAARFHRRCRTEMEAAAHYNAVAALVWPEQHKVFPEFPEEENKVRGYKRNKPHDGRPKRPVGRDLKGRRVIAIDKRYYAAVDERVYLALKDEMWFVREGHALRIVGCRLIEQAPWAEFVYQSMESIVFGGHCVHPNRHRLDNRRSNLISLEEAMDPANFTDNLVPGGLPEVCPQPGTPPQACGSNGW
jgi:hypothetical protein